tara:strand:+ start:712 stop:963 length:252 start_codon:yes stop_codon:yes gene_type:complete
MNTTAYETALRGNAAFQPMRNDALRGTSPFFGGTGLSMAGGVGLATALGIYSYTQNKGLSDNLMMSGIVALAGYSAGAFLQAQ